MAQPVWLSRRAAAGLSPTLQGGGGIPRVAIVRGRRGAQSWAARKDFFVYMCIVFFYIFVFYFIFPFQVDFLGQ
jgi:hypothetical protein